MAASEQQRQAQAGADDPGPQDAGEDGGSGKTAQIKVIGGLIALFLGLTALILVLLLAWGIDVSSSQFTQMATTVIGVIGSIVGAYFGVKIGTDGTQKALEAQRQESARSQIFAAHLPPDLAEQALDLAFSGSGNPPPGGEGGASPKPPKKPDPPTGHGAPANG